LFDINVFKERLEIYKNLNNKNILKVQIEVESMDKTGGFIGYMFVPTESGLKNVSEMLVENGLATVHFTADRSAYYNQLLSAEKKAKVNIYNLKKNYFI
jgi:staphylococcal nuclease domain-containing protein 1